MVARISPSDISTFETIPRQAASPGLHLFTSPSAFPNPQRLRLFMHEKSSDGRDWMLGGDAPTFSDMTMAAVIAFSKFPVNATPLDERFEHIDAFWRRWQARPSFHAAYADRSSGVPELYNLAMASLSGAL